MGAAGPIAETVVEQAESKRCEQLLRILLRSADPQDSMGGVQEAPGGRSCVIYLVVFR